METKEFSFKILEHLRRVCIRVGTIQYEFAKKVVQREKRFL
jgi:hypothetical protein